MAADVSTADLYIFKPGDIEPGVAPPMKTPEELAKDPGEDDKHGA